MNREQLIDFLKEVMPMGGYDYPEIVDHYLSTHSQEDELPESNFDENTECTLGRVPEHCSIIKYTQFKECIGCGHHHPLSKLPKEKSEYQKQVDDGLWPPTRTEFMKRLF